MRVEWIEDELGLEELAGDWEQLVPAGEPPFFRHVWFTTWWRSFGKGRRLAVATAWDEGRLTGVLPLCRDRTALHGLENDHTPIFAALGDKPSLEAMLDAAVRSSSMLTVSGLTAGERPAGVLKERARAARRVVLEQDYQRQAIVHTNGSWPEYRASLHRGFRKDVDRRSRRLREQFEHSFAVLEPPGDPKRQLTLGFETEASGWKGKLGTAVLNDPAAEDFYHRLATALAPDKALRVSALEVEGRYAAFDLSLIGGNRLWILKGGYDERFRRFSPGILLTLAEIRGAHELGLEGVELLGQTVNWKRRFANDERRQVFLGAYARTPSTLARYGLRGLRPWARAAYRHRPGGKVR